MSIMGEEALQAARALAVGRNPRAAADAVEATFEGPDDRGSLWLPFFCSPVEVTYPDLDVRANPELPSHIKALLLHHIARSGGARPTGRWIAFSELPDGTFYSTAFRGYAPDAIVRRLAARPEALSEAVARVGGVPLADIADRAWMVPALPRVPLALLWWDADEEFGARCDILFDSTAANHLSTDGCAVLGSWLVASLFAPA